MKPWEALGLIVVGFYAWFIGFVLLRSGMVGSDYNDMLASGSGGLLGWFSIWLWPVVPVPLALVVCLLLAKSYGTSGARRRL